jgi:hypothetical protein
MEKSATGTVGLNPFTIDDELRDSAFADVGEDLIGGAGRLFYVDFGVGNLVRLEKSFGLTTVTAPGS